MQALSSDPTWNSPSRHAPAARSLKGFLIVNLRRLKAETLAVPLSRGSGPPVALAIAKQGENHVGGRRAAATFLAGAAPPAWTGDLAKGL